MSLGTIFIETTGQYRSGVAAKSGRPYFMAQAFAHIPGVPYPQQFDYYCAAQNEVLAAGSYECDIQLQVRDGRLQFDVDPRQGKRSVKPAPAAVPAQPAQRQA